MFVRIRSNVIRKCCHLIPAVDDRTSFLSIGMRT